MLRLLKSKIIIAIDFIKGKGRGSILYKTLERSRIIKHFGKRLIHFLVTKEGVRRTLYLLTMTT